MLPHSQIYNHVHPWENNQQSSRTILATYFFPFLAIASLLLFIFSRKDGYNINDIRVTYILFSCTALLAFYAYLALMSGIFLYEVLCFRLFSTMMGSGWVFSVQPSVPLWSQEAAHLSNEACYLQFSKRDRQ